MCGLAGCFGVADDAAVAAVERMVQAQAHRGPDDVGIWRGRNAVLGHRRLAILDRSRAGHQPMADGSHRLRLVFNGEIYNFRTLRQSLLGQGYRFQTGTDTEVVLAAYHRHGPALPGLLTGMFALAIYDAEPPAGWPQLFLVRDRLGIKPLLYANTPRGLYFASELRALMASQAVGLQLDPAALADYLAVGAISQPRTLLRHVRALAPGHSLSVDGRGEAHPQRYWDLHVATEAKRQALRHVSAEGAALQVRQLLEEAATAHALADVPVGSLLSGGIDSAAATALCQPHLGTTTHTYCLGYDGPGDERAAAAQTATALGTIHHEALVRPQAGDGIFAAVVGAIDQPSVDGTNTYLVSQLARQHSTVVLSGLGADELFGGYPHFHWLAAAPRQASGLAMAMASRTLLQVTPHWRLLRAAIGHAKPAARAALLRRLLPDTALQNAATPALRPWAASRSQPTIPADADPVQAMTYAEMTGYLPNTLLRDADAMSMACQVELRPPFLHHPLVEYVYALPPHLKVAAGQGKRVLLQAVAHLLPDPVKHARKRGFELPQVGWLAQPRLRGRVDALLETPNAAALFTPSYRRYLRRHLRAGRPPRALWAWSVLLGYLSVHRLAL